ncbi:MAG: hypothetical protein JSS07_06180 [Proteobacteria bacterium]|nr:hypothetical protein [Pseudomonadota bacterium]
MLYWVTASSDINKWTNFDVKKQAQELEKTFNLKLFSSYEEAVQVYNQKIQNKESDNLGIISVKLKKTDSISTESYPFSDKIAFTMTVTPAWNIENPQSVHTKDIKQVITHLKKAEAVKIEYDKLYLKSVHQTELEELRKANADLTKEVALLKATKEYRTNKIVSETEAKLKGELDGLQKQMESLGVKLVDNNKANTDLQARIKELTLEMEDLKTTHAQDLVKVKQKNAVETEKALEDQFVNYNVQLQNLKSSYETQVRTLKEQVESLQLALEKNKAEINDIVLAEIAGRLNEIRGQLNHKVDKLTVPTFKSKSKAKARSQDPDEISDQEDIPLSKPTKQLKKVTTSDSEKSSYIPSKKTLTALTFSALVGMTVWYTGGVDMATNYLSTHVNNFISPQAQNLAQGILVPGALGVGVYKTSSLIIKHFDKPTVTNLNDILDSNSTKIAVGTPIKPSTTVQPETNTNTNTSWWLPDPRKVLTWKRNAEKATPRTSNTVQPESTPTPPPTDVTPASPAPKW